MDVVPGEGEDVVAAPGGEESVATAPGGEEDVATGQEVEKDEAVVPAVTNTSVSEASWHSHSKY